MNAISKLNPIKVIIDTTFSKNHVSEMRVVLHLLKYTVLSLIPKGTPSTEQNVGNYTNTPDI